MRNTGAGFVVLSHLSHHSLLLVKRVLLDLPIPGEMEG